MSISEKYLLDRKDQASEKKKRERSARGFVPSSHEAHEKEKVLINVKIADEAAKQRRQQWQKRVKDPIRVTETDIEIHVLDRPSSELSMKKFAENQILHDVENARTHQDPEQSGDPDVIRLALQPLEKQFAEIRSTGRAYARLHGAHIAPTFGSFAGVYAGTDRVEFLEYQKMAKTQAALKGEIRVAMLMQDVGNDLIHYTVRIYYPVLKIGTKEHRDRTVVDWSTETAKREKDVPVGGLGREQKFLKTAFSALRAEVREPYADFERLVKAEQKGIKGWVAKRASQRGTAQNGSMLNWLTLAVVASMVVAAIVR